MLQITDENFQQVLDSNKSVLVDFFAEWCAPCKVMLPQLEELESEKHNLVICKANVDDNDANCSQFCISSVPTVVLFSSGKEIARSVGLMNKNDLIEMASRVS